MFLELKIILWREDIDREIWPRENVRGGSMSGKENQRLEGKKRLQWEQKCDYDRKNDEHIYF